MKKSQNNLVYVRRNSPLYIGGRAQYGAFQNPHSLLGLVDWRERG
jgi:hypothetical protein